MSKMFQWGVTFKFMRIIFAGTADFAIPALKSVIHLCEQSKEYDIVGVYTQPDRPSGEGSR